MTTSRGDLIRTIPAQLIAVIALVTFTTVFVAPHNALAFTASFPEASAIPRITPADINTAATDFMGAALPTSHSFMSSSALAVTTPLTTPAIPRKKLTFAPATTPKPVPAPAVAVAAPAPTTTSVAATPISTSLVLEGEASYYSRAGCLGCHPAMIMANGQPLNDQALTMAIGADKKHLVGRQARVTSLATGKSVLVRITDTGGFYKAKYGHRVADLTIATKTAIGMAGGVGQVRVEVF